MNIFLIIAGIILAFFIMNVIRKTLFSSVMNPGEARERIESEPGFIIDVRTPAEYRSGHLKQTDYNWDVTSANFKKKLDELDKSKSYYLYCQSGNRSGKAAKIMKNHGFEKVYNIGGFRTLVNSGFEAASPRK